jgi:ATP-dependent helicase/nuclease subunit B
MNRLTLALADICNRHMLDEKWLIAPSRRVGQQWLQAVTRSGQSIINVRIKTLTSLAIDVAAEQMAARGLTLVSPRGGAFLVEEIIRRLRASSLDYLSQMELSAGLAEAVYAAAVAIRQSGLEVDSLDAESFEVAGKGQDLRKILQVYLKELETNQLIDDAELLRMATARIRADATFLPKNLRILVPSDIRFGPLEQQLIEAFSPAQRQTLPVDEPASLGDTAASDLELLRWLEKPTDAPPPFRDGTVRIRRAVGEINEVRDALRSCIAGTLRFDDLELLHTDAETYVPLIYETFCTLAREGETLGDDLPVTFAEGVPCRYSRPGRALALWLAWIADDYPQQTLVQLLGEGLLEVNSPGVEGASPSRLSGLLRGVGIGFGRERYQVKLCDRIAGLELQIADPSETRDTDGEPLPDRLVNLQRQVRDFQSLDSLCEKLLSCAPTKPASQGDLLTGAAMFLKTMARSVNQFDRFASLKIASEISDMQHWLALVKGDVSFNAWEWLARLPGEARVLGSGPRPGCLHVAHVASGGHSGRGNTVVIGLDDTRFPGAGLQDPLLLDSERRKISPDLVTAVTHLEHKLGNFTRLLARIRGKLTLSFCTRSVDDDREMFPCSPVLAAYRLISGHRSGDQSDLAAWLANQSPPASFAPQSQSECLNTAEWWLWRLCVATPVRDADALVLQHYPHLARGRFATRQRGLAKFTEFDGCVEQAGPDLDPTHTEHQILSPNRLQKIGKCPLMYFFEYGLSIAPPVELEVDSTVWLDPLAAGSLLHELFEEFMRGLLDAKEIPNFQRDQAQLMKLLDAQIERYRDLHPVPNESVFQQQASRLMQTALTFLREEERHCVREGSRPIYLEASLGMAAEAHGTPLDMVDPVPVNLSDKRQVLLRGRIDRIDQIGDGAVKTFAIWDYKTGSTWGYDRADPFRQGRVLQPYLYATMVTHRLREVIGKDAAVSYFGFFFPGTKARGERITWTREALAPGLQILEKLVQTVRNGAFLATNNVEDCAYCNYRDICDDVDSVAAASQAKLDSPENPLLTPMRDLRHE